MANKHFNENAFEYALNYIDKNPYEAKIRFEEYLEKYPNDYYARAYYVLLLERIGLFDLAQEEYDYIEKMIIVDTSFSKSGKRASSIKYILSLAKIRLLAFHEKYQEVLDFFYENFDLFEQRSDLSYLSYYCRSRLGKIKQGFDTSKKPYRFLQVVDYDENRFLEHIKKHEADFNSDLDEPNGTIFTPDFPVQEVVEEIKKYIPSDHKLFPAIFDDAYYFKYDNCGRINNKLTDYFVVICFHNQCQFLTMYPVNDCDFYPFTDLNYLKENEEEPKVKRLSQIEKFNKRFNLK